MKVKEAQELTNELLLTDILIRLTALEKALLNKEVVSASELGAIQKDLTDKIAKDILQKANIPGNIDDIISKISN